MHTERYTLPTATAEAINRAKAEGRRIIAVGTTTVRVLESVAKQSLPLTTTSGNTAIFIYPPRPFAVVDALITNFHLPQSTLLMLVSAFASPGALMDASGCSKPMPRRSAKISLLQLRRCDADHHETTVCVHQHGDDCRWQNRQHKPQGHHIWQPESDHQRLLELRAQADAILTGAGTLNAQPDITLGPAPSKNPHRCGSSSAAVGR